MEMDTEMEVKKAPAGPDLTAAITCDIWGHIPTPILAREGDEVVGLVCDRCDRLLRSEA